MPDPVVLQTDKVPQPTETKTPSQPSTDLSWIDKLTARSEPSQETREPEVRTVPVPVPVIQQPAEAPRNPLARLVTDVDGTIKEIANKIAEERIAAEVGPLRQAVQMLVGGAFNNAVETAVDKAKNNLRAYAARDASISDPEVVRGVNQVFSAWIRDAANGDARAIAALANDEAPMVVSQYVKNRMSARGPVQYTGGMTDARSTVSPVSTTRLSPEDMELASRWGASMGKDLVADWAKNEAEADRFLNQR